MAEKSGSRTHRTRLTRPTGFEDRAPHQGAIPFPLLRSRPDLKARLRESALAWMKLPNYARGVSLTTCKDLVSWLDDAAAFTFSLGEFLFVKVFEDLDRHVAPDTALIPERRDHQQMIV